MARLRRKREPIRSARRSPVFLRLKPVMPLVMNTLVAATSSDGIMGNIRFDYYLNFTRRRVYMYYDEGGIYYFGGNIGITYASSYMTGI